MFALSQKVWQYSREDLKNLSQSLLFLFLHSRNSRTVALYMYYCRHIATLTLLLVGSSKYGVPNSGLYIPGDLGTKAGDGGDWGELRGDVISDVKHPSKQPFPLVKWIPVIWR